MKLRITIRVSNDRDPALSTFTLARSVYMDGDQPPNPELLRMLIREQHGYFRASVPHNHRLPTFLPTDVDVVEVEDERANDRTGVSR